MAQRRRTAVPPPKSGRRGAPFLVGLGLVFAAGVGFAVGYTVGKKSSSMQPLTMTATRDKPRPPPAPRPRRQPPPDPLKAPKANVTVAAYTPIKGPKTAKVTIVEFSDFQ